MGDDNGPQSGERPAHEVYLNAFYIGRYPVTNGEYKRYMDDMGRAFDVLRGKADHPVVSISWYDARDYAAWAAMRLLTEAEWEKAASWAEEQRSRGARERGRKRRYPWGDKFDKAKCNTGESSIGDTTPVGRYSPHGDSPYGCADMAGNVWEWTSSLYQDYPYRADDGREDLTDSGDRVMRGGSVTTALSGSPAAPPATTTIRTTTGTTMAFGWGWWRRLIALRENTPPEMPPGIPALGGRG